MAARILSVSERIYKTHNKTDACSRDVLTSRHDERCFYKQWTELQMKGAVDAVVTSNLSVRRAAMQYNVPKSTLGDRVSGRVQPGSVSGPAKYLTLSEEDELSRFLSRCCQIGYARSKLEVLALVQRILDSKGMKVTISHGWWDSFRKRHPEFVLRVAAPVSQARSKATDPDVFSRYFDLLEETMKENKLDGKPGQIFNMDESAMPLDPKSPKLVFEKGYHGASCVTTGDKAQITIVACVSAAGFSLPPMVIWDHQSLSPELTIGEVPGTIYGLSKKGWIDYELFDVWFNNHFLRHVPTVRPILLMLDGHSSHYCPDTIRLAAKHQVILFALPPNTTHISQPLDKGCFSSLKESWKQVCHDFLTSNPGKVVTRYQFSQLFNKAWMQSMNISNITSGFKVTGIYPTDRQALLKLIPAAVSHSDIQEESGLAFIPLISPSVKSKSSKSTKAVNQEEQVQNSERELFEKWYKTNSGKATNDQYNAWLKENHPDYVWMKPLCTTGVEEFLSLPQPPCSIPEAKPKSSGRVLTSHENIKRLQEKEEAKRKAQIEREERKKAREAKQKQKEAEKAEKAKGKGKV